MTIHIIGDGGHAKVCREITEFGWYFHSEQQWYFVAVGDNAARKAEVAKLNRPFAVLKDDDAIISNTATYGQGCVFMAGAIVRAGAHIGEHVILNTGCVVDHDCVLEDFVHIAPGAHLCGGVHVGEGALVGVGVGVAPGAKIPPWTLVKARRLELCPMK